MVRGAFGDIDLLLAGITDCNKHTIDIHCPRFNESPTNISLLPLNFSHISITFHLQNKPTEKEKRKNQFTSNYKEPQNPNKLHTIFCSILVRKNLVWTSV